MCGFLLIGWWCGNRLVIQSVCSAWSYRPPPGGGGGLSSCRRAQGCIVLCVPGGGARTLLLPDCSCFVPAFSYFPG